MRHERAGVASSWKVAQVMGVACIATASLCLSSSCGRINYDPQGFRALDGSLDGEIDSSLMMPVDGGADSSLDGSLDTGAPPTCVRGPFSMPTLVRGPSTVEPKTGPSLTADGLLLVYVEPRVDVTVLLQSTRLSLSDAFSAPTALLGLCDGGACDPSLTPDGLGIYFRDGGGEIAYASRSSRDLPFDVPAPIFGPQSLFERPHAASISADGLSLYFHGWKIGREDADLFVAHRDDPTGGLFTRFEALDTINSPDFDENFPGVSLDGLELFFEYSSTGSADIWVAQRTDPADPFGPPAFVSELNVLGGGHGDPVLALDDQLILMTSDGRPGAPGLEIYTATRPCL